MNNDEVKRWYTKGSINLARIEEKYLPCVKGTSPKLTRIAILDGEAIGFLQAYSISDYLAYATQVGIRDSVGIDLFIGDSERVNKGLGSKMLKVFVEEVLPIYFSEKIAVIGPEPENKRAIRAYEKAGFHFSHQIENPREEMHEYLMRRKIP
ncbi:hypothetical protein SANA_32520 [Gottschalkiaceae bacterium SANA]|nr:hypothetical protein SANA_32520 [Gottschalkiaceae bacterium SANA]